MQDMQLENDREDVPLNFTSPLSASPLCMGFRLTALPPDGPMACTVILLVSSLEIMSAPYLIEFAVACLIFDSRSGSR